MASLGKTSMSSSRRVPCLWITVTELRLKKSLVSKISEHCQHAKTFEWKRVIVACRGKRGSRAFYSATRYTCLLISFDIFLAAFWQLSRGFFFHWPIKMPHARESELTIVGKQTVGRNISVSKALAFFLGHLQSTRLQKVVKKSSELNNFFKGSH